MKQEITAVWKKLPFLDAEIRTIEHQSFKKEPDYWFVEVGLYESLGEQGEILTLDYTSCPNEQEIVYDTKRHLQDCYKEYSERLLSAREERYLEILNRICS